VRFSAIPIAYQQFMLACWPLRNRLIFAYYNIFSNNSQKKTAKNELILNAPYTCISLTAYEQAGGNNLTSETYKEYYGIDYELYFFHTLKVFVISH